MDIDFGATVPWVLAENDVFSLAADADDSVWIGTIGGLTRYDPSAPVGAQWDTFTSADVLPHDVIWTIARGPSGKMVFGTPGGFSIYQDGRWTRHSL